MGGGRRNQRGLVTVLVTLAALLPACRSEPATPADDGPYVPPEASDTPTVDPDQPQIPDGPLFLARGPWTPVSTESGQLDPCLRERLVVLGASQLRMRSFEARQDDARAQDLVAAFNEADAARQAAYLFRRWHETCAERLGDEDVRPTATTFAGAGPGTAFWFTTLEDPRSRRPLQSATALIQAGRLVALVTIQDSVRKPDLERVEQMMERLLTRARSRLG